MSRRIVINLVFFVFVFALMVTWAVNNIITVDAIERPYAIKGEFLAASGVKTNAEVTYLGVHVGRVSGVTRIPGGVRITMKIDRDRHIPEATIARIFRKSAIGEPYIDFKPTEAFKDGGPAIKAGEVVPLSRTTVPLEFSELLRSASLVIGGIDPAKAHTLVHELAATLNGRSDALRQLTTASDTLTTAFVEHSAQLDRLATNNTRLTKVLADHRTSLGQSLTNLSLLADSLRKANGDTQVLLDRGSQLMGQTADLVSAEKRNLDCILGDLEDVIDLTTSTKQLSQLGHVLDNGPTAFSFVWITRDNEPDGLWVRVNLLAATDHPAPEYPDAPRNLPAVPAVPACASTLGSGGAAFTPSQTFAAETGSSLPATGGRPLVALGMFLVAGALAMLRVRGSAPRREVADG